MLRADACLSWNELSRPAADTHPATAEETGQRQGQPSCRTVRQSRQSR